MIWGTLFIPIFALILAILKVLSLIPIPEYPSQIHDAVVLINSYIWMFNEVYPVDQLFIIFGIMLAVDGFFALMWAFGWTAKKVPGVN